MLKQVENDDSRWRLPSGTPVARQGLFTLSQPSLGRESRSLGFQFYDATLLLVRSGRLTIGDGERSISAEGSASVILIPKNTRMDVAKYPGGPERPFRSVFLTFSHHTIAEFYRRYPPAASIPTFLTEPKMIPLDDPFADTLSYGLRGLTDENASDREHLHRLVGILLMLSDRGCQFNQSSIRTTGDRLREILKDDTSRGWTAPEAGRALGMSEATLRRRLAEEQTHFDDLLADVRMHHAMTLLQTTNLSIPQIANACGYRTRARFAERFRKRFGLSPSQAR